MSKRAQAEGYRARAAYKLIEVDDRHKLLKPGQRVVDLGAAPGGWCQVAVARVKSTPEAPRVVGIDYLDVDPVPGAIILKMDFLDDDAPARLEEALGGPADIVLSDLAAPTTGHRRTDHIRTMHLCEVAADFAISVLRPGGQLPRQDLSGRHGRWPARHAETQFRHRPARQAARLARGIGRTLHPGKGI